MATRAKATDTVSANGSTPEPTAPRVEVTRIGNLVQDPELRYTTKGQALCECDLAVNPKPNEDKETEFYRLLIFGPLGENVAESPDISKSCRVIVVGSPDIETWIDENSNETRTRKKIFVNAIGPDLRFAKVDSMTKIHRTNSKPAIELENF